MAEILVIAAHPHMDHSRVTRALMHAAAALGPRVAVRDLYALYPDYFIDVAAERAALAEARLVVWLHPVHWYSMPPLLKLWLDEVFGFGWAYGPGGSALAGKDLWLAAPPAGPKLRTGPMATTATSSTPSCTPTSRPPRWWACAGCRRWCCTARTGPTGHALQTHAAVLQDRLNTWPNWPEIAELEPAPDCAVPADARPQD
jgi:glutathione-regulated potassium-efflux system ancillary protein KefF